MSLSLAAPYQKKEAAGCSGGGGGGVLFLSLSFLSSQKFRSPTNMKPKR